MVTADLISIYFCRKKAFVLLSGLLGEYKMEEHSKSAREHKYIQCRIQLSLLSNVYLKYSVDT